VPSEKRARQRSAREARLAAEAKAHKRRRQYRNYGIVVVIAAIIVGVVFLVSSNGKTTPTASKSSTTTTAKGATTTTASTTTTTTASTAANAAAQATANKAAVAAGCPASTSARVNTQTYSAAPAMTIDTTKTYTATVVTTDGTFTITLDAKAAPTTVNSFVFLADKGYFNCNIFARVIPGFVDQTGDPTGTGSGGPGYEFANENVPKSYATGDVAMANSGANTNGSQFFLVAPGGATQLDADLASGGYSLFGQVTSGMSVVEAINAEGSASGVPPDVTQRIISVTIHDS
jgi:peptidyl-prolyl cis-trans isomerase B (cyclophilin B)